MSGQFYRKCIMLLSSLWILAALPVSANESNYSQVSATPIAQQGGDHSITRPSRGMAMTEVETKFGAPQQIAHPKGEPPITRWQYPSFTVYFEHQYVIHSVLHK